MRRIEDFSANDQPKIRRVFCVTKQPQNMVHSARVHIEGLLITSVIGRPADTAPQHQPPKSNYIDQTRLIVSSHPTSKPDSPLVYSPHYSDSSAHNHSEPPKAYHQQQHHTPRRSSHHCSGSVSPSKQTEPCIISYLAPPDALLNHEHTSCEKQSCVYALPTAVPEHPAPQRPLQE